MISTRSAGLLIDTVVCLTLAKWETVSGRFGGYLSTDGHHVNTGSSVKVVVERTIREPCAPIGLARLVSPVLIDLKTNLEQILRPHKQKIVARMLLFSAGN